VKDMLERISGHIQAKVSNSSEEKNANYCLGIKNVECFYLTCALLSGWCYDLTCAMLKCKVSPQLKFSTYYYLS
jgi:hypothetical protein